MSQWKDPRHYQIAVLGSLVVYGFFGLDLEIAPGVAAVLMLTSLATQLVCSELFGVSRFDPKSACISGLSLCLLLRTNSLALAAVAAVVTIASKFVLRVDDRHVFNPTNFGIVVMMLVSHHVWVSPGQWGAHAVFAFMLACLGGVVIRRAARSDVTYAFIASYALIVVGRALWLGDPLMIPIHQLQNGAFVLFAFFMISDPKTTPDSRAGRILYAALVASGAAVVHFVLYEPNGFLWSLVVCAPTVPIFNRLLPGSRFEWRAPVLESGGALSERSFA